MRAYWALWNAPRLRRRRVKNSSRSSAVQVFRRYQSSAMSIDFLAEHSIVPPDPVNYPLVTKAADHVFTTLNSLMFNGYDRMFLTISEPTGFATTSNTSSSHAAHSTIPETHVPVPLATRPTLSPQTLSAPGSPSHDHRLEPPVPSPRVAPRIPGAGLFLSINPPHAHNSTRPTSDLPSSDRPSDPEHKTTGRVC